MVLDAAACIVQRITDWETCCSTSSMLVFLQSEAMGVSCPVFNYVLRLPRNFAFRFARCRSSWSLQEPPASVSVTV